MMAENRVTGAMEDLLMGRFPSHNETRENGTPRPPFGWVVGQTALSRLPWVKPTLPRVSSQVKRTWPLWTGGPVFGYRQSRSGRDRSCASRQCLVHSAEKRWYIVAENGWYIVAEKRWRIVAEKRWYISR